MDRPAASQSVSGLGFFLISLGMNASARNKDFIKIGGRVSNA